MGSRVKERNSAVELLRILAMFLIVLHHFCVHGSWVLAEQGTVMGTVISALSFGGKVGVDVFMIISGYFGVAGRFHSRSLLRIVLEAWFYAWVLLGVFTLRGSVLVTPDVVSGCLLPLLSGLNWFVTYYLGVVLLSPFINLALRRAGRSVRLGSLCAAYALLVLVPVTLSRDPFAGKLVFFIFLYALGASLRLDGFGHPERHGLCWVVFCPTWLPRRFPKAMAVACLLGAAGAAAWTMFRANHGGPTLEGVKVLSVMDMTSPFVLLFSIALLVLFLRMKPFASRFVNGLAATTLGIYLIHDNPLVRCWIWPHFAFALELGPLGFVGVALGVSAVVFLVCGGVDWLRARFLEPPAMRLVNRVLGRQLDAMDASLTKVAEAERHGC